MEIDREGGRGREGGRRCRLRDQIEVFLDIE